MVRKRTVAITTGAIAATVGLIAVPLSVMADQVILDDLIVDGSACVGFDCVNGESFGFDTIRIKENNLRITAQDTSNSASFPTQDWQLTFNDSSNGGANKFSIDAIAPATATPFTILSSARTNAIFASGSNVGFGTSTPTVGLHYKNGNTPTVRLEQDGTSGFTAQTWDLAGNEANFFIRDATNGSTLPFRIQPGAPSNAIYIENTGDIGLGTTSPEKSLHIRDSGSQEIRVESTGAGNAGFNFINTAIANPWNVFSSGTNGNFNIANAAVGSGTEMSISATNGVVKFGEDCIELGGGFIRVNGLGNVVSGTGSC